MSKDKPKSTLKDIPPMWDALMEYASQYNTDSIWDNMRAEYSVSNLIQPPRIVQLERRYRHIIRQRPVEPEKKKAAFRGNGYHDHVEKYLRLHATKNPQKNYLVEATLWDRIANRKIKGRIDVWLDKVLYDIKTTSTWKKMMGDYTDWEKQLNIYAYLLALQNIPVEKLAVIAVYNDFQKYNIYKKGYPKEDIELIPIDRLWSFKQQKDYLYQLINFHKKNETLPDAELSPCTSKDRWDKKSGFAVYKVDHLTEKYSEKAARVLDSEKLAQEWIAEKTPSLKTNEGYEIVERKGSRVRCEDWCEVNEFCSQYIEYKETA